MSEGLCPACGAANQCAMAADGASSQCEALCWCRGVSVSQVVLKQLKRLYPADQCLCQSCLIAYKLASENNQQGE
jgi:hypothetical protein